MSPNYWVLRDETLGRPRFALRPGRGRVVVPLVVTHRRAANLRALQLPMRCGRAVDRPGDERGCDSEREHREQSDYVGDGSPRDSRPTQRCACLHFLPASCLFALGEREADARLRRLAPKGGNYLILAMRDT